MYVIPLAAASDFETRNCNDATVEFLMSVNIYELLSMLVCMAESYAR